MPDSERRSSGSTGEDLFSTAAFGGAIVLVVAGLGAETINMVGAFRADDGQLSAQLGRALFEISYPLSRYLLGPAVFLFAVVSANLLRAPRPDAVGDAT